VLKPDGMLTFRIHCRDIEGVEGRNDQNTIHIYIGTILFLLSLVNDVSAVPTLDGLYQRVMLHQIRIF
jgi:hypothetical protein